MRAGIFEATYVELDVRPVAPQALGKRVVNCLLEDSGTDLEMDKSLEVQAEVPQVHTTGTRATSRGRERHTKEARPSSSRGQELPGSQTRHSRHLRDTSLAQQRRRGPTEHALPGTLTKRRAFSYTRRQDLYPIHEDDLQAAMARTV